MTTDFTDNDLLLLEKQRMGRFRSLFAEILGGCFLHLDRYNSLTIHCTEPWMVDQLLDEIAQLCCTAWTVMGAEYLAIYFAQEEIYAVNTRPAHQSESKVAPVQC
jgi:hypothetical protein